MVVVFQTLKRVVRHDIIVLPHVPMTRVLRPFGQLEQRERQRLAAALDGIEADFVLCAGKSLQPEAVIMLEEHGAEVEPIFEHIGVRFFRLPMKGAVNRDYLHTLLDAYTSKNEEPKSLSDTQTVLPRKYCAKCQSEMVVKRARGGPWEGSLFWVCSRYPRCKTSELHRV